MHIEIQIRVGTRQRLESGTIKWDEYEDHRNLVTYHVDKIGAIREALFQTEKSLRKALDIDSLQDETGNKG